MQNWSCSQNLEKFHTCPANLYFEQTQKCCKKYRLVLLPVCLKSVLAQVKAKPSKHHLTNCLPLHANRVIFRPFHANRVIFAPFTHFLPLCSPCACWPTPIRVGKWCKKMVELHKIDLMVFNTQPAGCQDLLLQEFYPFPFFHRSALSLTNRQWHPWPI